jgi:cellulose synthase/poly-beta-1,6-N-acetylglucosamine synthase-like glycosyltransferase
LYLVFAVNVYGEEEMDVLNIVRIIVEGLYLLSLIGLAVYGINNLISTILYLRCRDEEHHVPPMAEKDLPHVTIQLPVFNERYTVERLINAAVRLDYPREKLQIQVLDDSTDDTSALVQRLVDQHQKQGINIIDLHRTNRSGFKAGALSEGLKVATGELVAIFDADFVPRPNWLMKAVPEFCDEKLGCLQTRWGHLNSRYNTFTRAQALGIDGHFVVEQTARSRNGLFMNFNGTAGVWRRACIEDAGGWQADTLTEDLDLSYRAQLHGWHIGYLPDVVVPAELPAPVEAYKQQQFRWAKGSFQTVKKLVPLLMEADIPEYKRIMGLIHITAYIAHPLMLLSLVLLLPIGLIEPEFLRMFPWTAIAAFGPPMLYLCARTEYEPRLLDRLSMLPLLVLIGFGLSLNNTIAVMQGLFGTKRGTFVRTPKLNITDSKENTNSKIYTMPISPMIWGELGLAVYSVITIFVLLPIMGWGIIPWVLVYTAGYLYMAGLNLYQHFGFSRRTQTVDVRVS